LQVPGYSPSNLQPGTWNLQLCNLPLHPVPSTHFKILSPHLLFPKSATIFHEGNPRLMKKLLVLVCLLSASCAYAQTVLETNPASLKWNQINTPNFRILFPAGFESQAQRMANTLEHIRVQESKSMGVPPRKISLILQNQSSVSNGFVSMFPRRTEFYTMPTQNYNFGGTNDWLNLLASHEYRHVIQYRHSLRGFTGAMYYLFGAPTAAGFAHAAVPSWFWEGDAVATETAFTPGGRGKIPNFGLLFRTNILEGRSFNYHKQYLQSYKHNIPDHYVLGYHMVSYLRKKTNDPEIWEKITGRAWSVPFVPFTFSNAIHNKTGMYVTKLYKEMASEMKKQWEAQVQALELSSFERINNVHPRTYTDYMFPRPQADGSILVRKEGIGNIEEFTLLRNGAEERVFIPGFLNDAGMLSTSDEGVLVWNEYGFDPRWAIRNYSRIKAFDSKTNKFVILSDARSRYAGAAISPDGKKIVTVRTNVQYQHNIVILSYPTGDVLKELENVNNNFYSMVRWDDKGERIVALKTTSKGRSVVLLDPGSGDEREIVAPSRENIGHPVVHGQYLFINSPASGIDNIHVIDLTSGKRYQVTTSKYGAYNPAISADDKWIYYNDQGRDGMNVVKMAFDPTLWKEVTTVQPPGNFYQHLVEQEGRPTLLDSIPENVFPVTKFSKAAHAINPFSWGTFIQNDLSAIDLGVNSQDVLSTTSIGLGYRYDLNERTGVWRAGVSYQGWYPIVDLEFTQGKRSVNEGSLPTHIVNGSDSVSVMQDAIFKWTEQNVTAGLRLPLNFTNSRYSTSVTLGNSVGYTHVTDFRNRYTNSRLYPYYIKDGDVLSAFQFYDYVGNGNLIYNYASLSAYRLLKQSKRDINSKWGQALFLNYYNTPYGGDLEGELLSATAYLFVPGIFKHHSLYGHAAFQHSFLSHSQDGIANDYVFRNTVPIPRGHSVARFENFISTSINYALPLWYPDIALGPIVNIQRIKLNLFSDYAIGDFAHLAGYDENYHSVGGELTLDLNFFRFQPQFDLGVRYSYGVSHTFSNFELVIGTFNF
jgi:hypothetical protein